MGSTIRSLWPWVGKLLHLLGNVAHPHLQPLGVLVAVLELVCNALWNLAACSVRLDIADHLDLGSREILD
jgi:hypothetical protein